MTQETSAVDFRKNLNQTLSSWACYYVSGEEQGLWFTMWVVCVALKEDLFQSVISYSKHSLARNTPPHYKGCIRNLGSNPKGLTSLHLHIIDTCGLHGMNVEYVRHYEGRRCQTSKPTVENVALLRKVPGPTLQGNPAAKCPPSTTRSYAKMPGAARHKSLFSFLVKQLVNSQTCLHLQRAGESHEQLVRRRCRVGKTHHAQT